MSKPSAFIGSSTEGLEFARAIRALVRDEAEVTLWNEGVFTIRHAPFGRFARLLPCDRPGADVSGDSRTVGGHA